MLRLRATEFDIICKFADCLTIGKAGLALMVIGESVDVEGCSNRQEFQARWSLQATMFGLTIENFHTRRVYDHLSQLHRLHSKKYDQMRSCSTQ